MKKLVPATTAAGLELYPLSVFAKKGRILLPVLISKTAFLFCHPQNWSGAGSAQRTPRVCFCSPISWAVHPTVISWRSLRGTMTRDLPSSLQSPPSRYSASFTMISRELIFSGSLQSCQNLCSGGPAPPVLITPRLSPDSRKWLKRIYVPQKALF